MERRTLLGSDLKVSPVCVGTWQFNDNFAEDMTWAPQPYEVSKSIVDKALECGVNFFDTAEGYKNAEGVVGRIFEGRRRDVILATKFGYRGGNVNYSAKDVEESIMLSLNNLKTDYIDIYQCHWPNVIPDMPAVIAELDRQKSLGHIRYYSVCNFGPQNLKDFLSHGGKPLTNQIAYNLLWRGAEYDATTICRQNDISILPYSPLQQGLLTGKFLKADDVPAGRRRTRHFRADSAPKTIHGESGAEVETFQTIARIKEIAQDAGLSTSKASLSWLLQQTNVASVIVGTSRPEQIVDNCEIVKLQQDVLDKLSLASDDLKTLFNGTMDMWSPTPRIK